MITKCLKGSEYLQTKEITELFKQKGIKATAQRIAVYKYLYENRIHPDVDTVYKNLVEDNPSFSKTTVYNCLQTLADCGLIIPVMIESEKIRYDANPNFHSHFKCRCCGGIFDFTCKVNDIEGLDGFDVEHRDVYFSGICKNCKSKN